MTLPVPLDDTIVEWPAEHARSEDLLVPVTLVISSIGNVTSARIEQNLGEPFDSAVLASARKLRFTPGHDERGARAARIRVLMRFLANSSAPTSASSAETLTTAALPAAGPAVTPATEPVAAPQLESAAPVSAPREITVLGTPPPRSASDALISSPWLRAAPHKNSSELLRVVPGVFVSQHSGEGKAHQIFFRGYDAVHGQDVELWAGGAPVNDVSNIHGQGYADLHFLIPEVVRTIHSTPGTYDPRQGDFAIAGSLRFDLGYDEPGLTIKGSLGSFGTRRYFMAYRPRTANADSFGAFELRSTDGFGPARAARHASAITQAYFALGGGVRAGFQASAYAGRFDSAGVLRLDDIESGAVDRFESYEPKQGGASSRAQLVLSLSKDAEANANLGDHKERWSIAPFLVLRSLELRSNFTGALTSPDGDSIQQRNDATSVGATAAYTRSLPLLSSRDSLEAGLYLRSDFISQSQHRLATQDDRVTDDARSPGIDNEVRASNVAGYVDLSLHPVPRVTLRGGLRADGLSYLTQENGSERGQARSALGAQLSKRATLDVVTLPGLHALLSYGEGFRSPQARSLSDGEKTPFTRSVSIEAGLRYRLDPSLEASLAVYHTRLSDDLVFDHTTARNERVPSTSRTGLAVNLLARPTSWFLSSTSLTYARAVFERGNAQYQRGTLLPYAPQLVVRSDVALSPTLGSWKARPIQSHFGAGLSYIGRRPLPYGEFGRDQLVIDAGAELRWGPIQTGIEVFNLFNAQSYDGEFVYASKFRGAAALVPVRHVTVGAPRTFLWTLSLFV